MAAIVLLLWLQLPTQLSADKVEQVMKSFGILGPLILIGLYTLTIVFSPLAGSPFIVVSLILFGLPKSLLYIYTGNLIGASINFFIARKVGRPIVIRFVGIKIMKQVDEIAKNVGLKTLIVLRLIGIGAFDIISYAAGFTSMSFYIYLLVTAICSIPSLTIIVYMVDRAISLPKVYFVPVFIVIYFLAIFIPLYMYKHQKIGKINRNLR